ncbi:MAG: GNAT family N-acetyltransferase [Bacteroidales bacterium]|nr:GNAT family N-acetyltransferase [Bacteroidales bacterium]
MNTIICKRYNSSLASEWDRVVEESRNGTFLFKRNYLDYHSDRFSDHSLMFELGGEIVALLPANQKEGVIYSHQGLTYGGVIMTSRCKGAVVLEIFEKMIGYYRANGIKAIIYKPVPHIYHIKPSEEDIYALYRYKAELYSCGISSTIDLTQEICFNSLRTRGVKKALANNVEIKEEFNFAPFWEMLTQNLQQRHSVSPVHTLKEIEMLRDRFPENIRLYTASQSNELLAGVVIYETATCIHSQYIASSQKGRDLSALDLLFLNLIKERYKEYRYFDFGISTESNGDILNNGLLSQKEGFGATATIYNSYKITL